MMKVLLADDEARTLHHLKTSVPWAQLELEVVGTAANGEEALTFLQTHPVDILITDIRMPGMDGLELCQRLRAMERDVQIILLTGYADFEYARRGIALQVTDYCLKPIDVAQLSETLRRTVRESRVDTSTYADALLDLVEEGSAQEIRQAFADFGLKGDGVYLAGSIGVHNIGRELGAALSYKVGKHKYLYFSAVPFDGAAAARIITFAKGRSGIALPPDPVPYHEVRRAIDDVLVMSFQYFVNGSPTLCDHLVEGALTQDMFRQLNEYRSDPLRLKEWLAALSRANCSMLFNIRTAFRFFTQLLLCPVMENGITEEAYLYGFEQLAADYLHLTDLFFDLSATLYLEPPVPTPTYEGPSSFLAIMKYLNDNYARDVSLKRISEELHLNSCYISQLIKSETGLTYTQYITELRIGKAKDLLMTTHLSLAEISEAVGFNDYFYFIKKFKREVGVTPGKFLLHEKKL